VFKVESRGLGMDIAISVTLGLLFLVASLLATCLRMICWRSGGVAAGGALLLRLRGVFELIYAAIYVLMMFEMLPRLWAYQVELPLLYEKVCAECHPLADIEAHPPRSAEEVAAVIERMIVDNGLVASKEEIELIYGFMVNLYVDDAAAEKAPMLTGPHAPVAPVAPARLSEVKPAKVMKKPAKKWR